MPDMFVTAAELAGFTQQSLDTYTAELVIRAATGKVQNEARQRIVRVAGEAAKLYANRFGEVVLPERPVEAVTAVVLGDGTSLASAAYKAERDVLYRIDAGTFVAGEKVTVTYTHGFAVIPEDVRGLTLALAARLLDNPEALRTVQVGGYGATYAIPGLELGEDERATCHRYRRRTHS